MPNLRGEFKVRYQGKNYTSLVNLNAIRMVCQEYNVKFSNINEWMSESPFTAVPAICYYGVHNYNLYRGLTVEMPTFESFCSHVLDDIEIFEELTKNVSEVFDSAEEEAAKKKDAGPEDDEVIEFAQVIQTGVNFGLTPHEVWGLSLWEFHAIRNGYEFRLARQWDMASSMMALFAQAHAPKGRTFNQRDFHPLLNVNSTRKDVEKNLELLDKMKQWNAFNSELQ